MNAEKQQLTSIESNLTELFLAFCNKHHLEPFSVAADYHGSLTWQVLWTDSLKRQVSLLATLRESDSAVIEISIAAGNDDIFAVDKVGQWVWSLHASPSEFENPLKSTITGLSSDLKIDVQRGLEAAYVSAEAITPEKLDRTYPLPRRA